VVHEVPECADFAVHDFVVEGNVTDTEDPRTVLKCGGIAGAAGPRGAVDPVPPVLDPEFGTGGDHVAYRVGDPGAEPHGVAGQRVGVGVNGPVHGLVAVRCQTPQSRVSNPLSVGSMTATSGPWLPYCMAMTLWTDPVKSFNRAQ